jgi:hypothetical protein
LRRQTNDPSWLDTLFGLCALTFLFAMLCYGLPPLFFADTSLVLSYSMMAGDALQLVALFWLWLAVARIYFPDKKSVFYLVLFLDLLVVLAGIVFAVQENLAYPVMMKYVGGVWQIDFFVSVEYQIAVAIQYISLMLVGVRFGLQSWRAPKNDQKIRLLALAVLCFVISGLFIFRPVLGLDTATNSISYVMAVVLLLVAMSVAASLVLSKRGRKS